jgi:hypothetical protein
MRIVLVAAVAVASGCCFAPQPVAPITPPPATAVLPGGGPQLPSTSPTEAVAIASGFTDPMLFHGIAGGPRDASATFGPDCRGQLPMTPSHRFRLDSSFPYLRIMARGDSDLTLVVRTPRGQSRCNDDSDGLNPVVDGAFEPGVYDVYVGLYSAGTPAPYDLGVSTNASVMPTTMLTTVAPSVGATVRSGVLTVTAASGGVASVGDTCTYSEAAVVATSAGHDVRWNITCGISIVYGAGNGGYGRSTDAAWPPGTIAYDLETSEVDTDPAFEWTASSVRVHDDASGPLGAFDLSFQVP